MIIEVLDTEQSFRVIVKRDDGEQVFECGWHGSPSFVIGKEEYCIVGPYQGYDEFRLCRMIQVAQTVRRPNSSVDVIGEWQASMPEQFESRLNRKEDK